MASYRLEFKRSVTNDLRELPKQHIRRMLDRIEALSEEPRPPGCEKLSAAERTACGLVQDHFALARGP